MRWQVTLGMAGNIFLNRHRSQLQTENLSCPSNLFYISLLILILSEFLNEIHMNESSITMWLLQRRNLPDRQVTLDWAVNPAYDLTLVQKVNEQFTELVRLLRVHCKSLWLELEKVIFWECLPQWPVSSSSSCIFGKNARRVGIFLWLMYLQIPSVPSSVPKEKKWTTYALFVPFTTSVGPSQVVGTLWSSGLYWYGNEPRASIERDKVSRGTINLAFSCAASCCAALQWL